MAETTWRRWTAIGLIVGPALFFVDNLIHPQEVGRGNEVEQLAAIAAAPERWQIAHMVGFASLPFFAVAILGLAWLVGRRRPHLGLAGGALGVVGLLAVAFAFALDGFAWGALGELSSRPGLDEATLVTALEEIQGSGWVAPYFALAAGWIAGLVVLAWAAVPQIGWRAASLLAFGALLVGLGAGISDNAFYVASSAMLLVGGIDAGVAVLRRRSSDEALPV